MWRDGWIGECGGYPPPSRVAVIELAGLVRAEPRPVMWSWDFGLMTRQRSQASKNGLGLIWGLIGLADLVVRALSWGSGHYYELSVLSTGQSRITVDPQCFVVCCVHHLAVVQCWIFSALKYLKISWKSYSGDGGPWLLVPLPLAVPL